MCAGLLLAGCKKDAADVGTNPPLLSSSNTVRTLSEAETNQLVADAQAFNQYAVDLKQNSTATLPAALPAELTPEEGVTLTENTFNYYYARLLNNSTMLVSDLVLVPVALNSNGKVTLQTVGNAFNAARVAIHNRFKAITGSPEKQFTLVDVEWGPSGGGAFKFRYNIDEPSLVSETDSFAIGDNWHWRSKSGKQGTTAFDGLKGAPEVLSSKVSFRIVGIGPINAN